MQLLAHPFRLTGGGAATVTDGSEAADVDAVARMALTRLGELDLVPAYGLPDPVFADALTSTDGGATHAASIDVARLNAGLATFGPPVQVTLAAASSTTSTQSVTLEVSRA